MERIYRPDQEVLDARGINMSVAEVVGLSTSEYAARLRRLNLPPHDAAFVKSLRRRIKNRMASQNSRRRTAEHIRSLTDELRAVRASKDDIVGERVALAAARADLARELRTLRDYITEKLRERGDNTELPDDTEPSQHPHDLQADPRVLQADPRVLQAEPSTAHAAKPHLSQTYPRSLPDLITDKKNVFECRLESLVQRSVSHMFKFDRRKASDRVKSEDTLEIPLDIPEAPCNNQIANGGSPDANSTDENGIASHNGKEDAAKTIELMAEMYRRKTLVDIFRLPPKEAADERKIVRAKCVSVGRDDSKEEINARKPRKRMSRTAEVKPKRNGCIVHTSDVHYETCFSNRNVYLCAGGEVRGEVLNLSLKERGGGERRHHGRKQAAPRRIAHVPCDDDMVLDLKIKKSCD